ncbi:MAG: ParA family protein [Saprospiraceae bacterium]
MSKIIIFGNQKGGVGKSTITCLCANALSQAPYNYKVCVIDTDKQRSISEAREFDEEGGVEASYPVFQMTVGEMQKRIADLDREYDLVFIDTAGKLDVDAPIKDQEITKGLMYADFLFIPFRAGNFNLDATLSYLRYLLKVQEQRADSSRPLVVQGFINMYRQRSKMNDLLISEVKHLKNGGLPFMVSRLGNYTLFEDVDTITSIYDEDTNNRAKLNFTVWMNELIKFIAEN